MAVKNVFKAGIVVRTTLQPKLQKIAEQSLQKGLERYDMRHGRRSDNITFDRDDINISDLAEKLKDFNITQSYKKI